MNQMNSLVKYIENVWVLFNDIMKIGRKKLKPDIIRFI